MQSLHGVANGWTELEESGWLQYAASNDLIIVFPQVWNTISNFGCFDTRGSVSSSYIADSNENVQVRFVVSVIDALTAERDSRIWDRLGNRNQFGFLWWIYDGPYKVWHLRFKIWQLTAWGLLVLKRLI